MDSLTVSARAKINLYLDVTGRRADGYHLLETVMHTVSLCDTVTLTKTGKSGIEISCSDPLIPCDEKNIAYKCAAAFFEKTGICGGGVSIDIIKNIPSQAGMGGGSADGAAVLTGLNRLFSAELSENELISLGARIGADIPFCIKGGCGYCTGIGEIIEPLPKISGTVLMGKGAMGISTPEAFKKIDSAGYRIGTEGVKDIFGSVCSLKDIAPYCRNIFDEVSCLDEVSHIKKIMTDNGAVRSLMTGSGSAVFGLYESETSAEKAYALLKQYGYFSALCSLV
ncbi:MAG: 4-(cytidine 5'-diphospho)-2-C-methyl-D-erythritol kinase [Huintestinicola sp.]|uniref:4-(cytidine 5'-diphospho)-2-C-methyl-D-erythritol kinase n=1 Tax=Huintestinicola sp. TaxID=2981661 RepID=UPI003EFC84A6